MRFDIDYMEVSIAFSAHNRCKNRVVDVQLFFPTEMSGDYFEPKLSEVDATWREEKCAIVEAHCVKILEFWGLVLHMCAGRICTGNVPTTGQP